MTLGRAYAGIGGDTTVARPYLELAHNSADEDVLVSTTLINWVWSAATFDTTNGGLTFDGVDEVTVVDTATYRIEFTAVWNTTDDTRMQAQLQRDPLAVGSYAFVNGGIIYGNAFGASPSGSTSVTLVLTATDKLRIQTRRLVGGVPSTTLGSNGSIWRFTKLT